MRRDINRNPLVRDDGLQCGEGPKLGGGELLKAKAEDPEQGDGRKSHMLSQRLPYSGHSYTNVAKTNFNGEIFIAAALRFSPYSTYHISNIYGSYFPL